MNPNKLELIHELAKSIVEDKSSGFSESTLADATLDLIKAYQELRKENERLNYENGHLTRSFKRAMGIEVEEYDE